MKHLYYTVRKVNARKYINIYEIKNDALKKIDSMIIGIDKLGADVIREKYNENMMIILIV